MDVECGARVYIIATLMASLFSPLCVAPVEFGQTGVVPTSPDVPCANCPGPFGFPSGCPTCCSTASRARSFARRVRAWAATGGKRHGIDIPGGRLVESATYSSHVNGETTCGVERLAFLSRESRSPSAFVMRLFSLCTNERPASGFSDLSLIVTSVVPNRDMISVVAATETGGADHAPGREADRRATGAAGAAAADATGRPAVATVAASRARI